MGTFRTASLAIYVRIGLTTTLITTGAVIHDPCYAGDDATSSPPVTKKELGLVQEPRGCRM